VRTHLALATATLASGVLALALPLTANADQPRPVIASGSDTARVVHAPAVTVSKAGTSTTIGQTGPGGGCSPGSVTAVQASTGAAPAYTTPAGVITSFAYQGNAVAGQVQAVLYGPETSPGNRTVVTKSAKVGSVAAVLNTYPVRIPVTAGLALGVWIENIFMNCAFVSPGAPGDIVDAAIVDPDVTPAFSAAVTQPNTRANVSAVVESDADGDGYGDVSQDLCPQSKLTQSACPAPDTRVTKKPKKSSTQRTVKIKFRSSIAASTFTCAVDKKKAKPCTSPFKKRFKYGKHKVMITATSPVGIVDTTPAVVKFRVKRPAR
jgi:hypothetical protein